MSEYYRKCKCGKEAHTLEDLQHFVKRSPQPKKERTEAGKWTHKHENYCRDCRSLDKRKWAKDNAEKVRKDTLRRQHANLEQTRKKQSEWRKANRGKSAKWAGDYRAACEQRSVAWADEDKIAQVYDEAAKRTQETDIPHDVDHIIPLRGERVSGLHVHTNLTILEASENRRKGNTWEI